MSKFHFSMTGGNRPARDHVKLTLNREFAYTLANQLRGFLDSGGAETGDFEMAVSNVDVQLAKGEQSLMYRGSATDLATEVHDLLSRRGADHPNGASGLMRDFADKFEDRASNVLPIGTFKITPTLSDGAGLAVGLHNFFHDATLTPGYAPFVRDFLDKLHLLTESEGVYPHHDDPPRYGTVKAEAALDAPPATLLRLRSNTATATRSALDIAQELLLAVVANAISGGVQTFMTDPESYGVAAAKATAATLRELEKLRSPERASG